MSEEQLRLELMVLLVGNNVAPKDEKEVLDATKTIDIVDKLATFILKEHKAKVKLI